MRKSPFTENQIVNILRNGEAGVSVPVRVLSLRRRNGPRGP
jgi:hypothetical protein